MQDPDVIRLLEQIRDLQNAQLEGQREILKTQQAHMALYQSHLEQVQRINDKAEKNQDRGAELMSVARKSVSIILVVVILLIGYLTWLLVR